MHFKARLEAIEHPAENRPDNLTLNATWIHPMKKQDRRERQSFVLRRFVDKSIGDYAA
jgi:hypothetical protein